MPEAEIARLNEAIEYREYRKNQFLTRQGEIENFVYFIIEGLIRNYVTINSKEITLDFFFSGDFTNSYTSFLKRDKSVINVRTLLPTKIFRVNVIKVEELYKDSIHFNKLGRLIAEYQYMRRTKRELSLISQTAKERYNALFSENPLLIREIPLKHLATYLGIKAETLSRIRAAESKKK